MSDKQLTPEQKNAVDKDGAILVGAAAGSGKTFVLT
ncbi:MAG: UvrD-helicase domain-containing protein, partial [Oscillospiraceae bacterium]|nr:UvrD-helicase domain-containing protein [Oscillospiraceae bacterium]